MPAKFHWLSAILLIVWPVNEWKRKKKKNHRINEFDQNKSKHRMMIIGDKSAADTQNLSASPRDKPPPQTYEHPVSFMCKNKALRIQWPEISVECVSAWCAPLCLWCH